MKRIYKYFTGLALSTLLLVGCNTNGSSKSDSSGGNSDGSNSQVENYYTVTWKNYDGAVLETDTNVKEGTMPHYDAITPTRPNDDTYTYTFAGWTPSVVEVEADAIYTATYTQTAIASLPYNRNGNKIYFGTYPQTKVEATSENGLASIVFDASWTSYRYYIESTQSDFMYYKDVDIDNDGTLDYRGVYFTQYRPSYFEKASSEANSHQKDMGYSSNTVYWFSYDPVEWDILTESSGKAFLVANLILDSQDYYLSSSTESFTHNGGTGYANNYELSNIRKWLNDNFYNATFNNLEKAIIETTKVDNSVASTGYEENPYKCNNTNDKVFLLSELELQTYYQDSSKRQAKATDYAYSQGTYYYNFDNKYCYWWSRSPHNSKPSRANVAYNDGFINGFGVGSIDCGVRPACWVKL